MFQRRHMQLVVVAGIQSILSSKQTALAQINFLRPRKSPRRARQQVVAVRGMIAIALYVNGLPAVSEPMWTRTSSAFAMLLGERSTDIRF